MGVIHDLSTGHGGVPPKVRGAINFLESDPLIIFELIERLTQCPSTSPNAQLVIKEQVVMEEVGFP